MRQEELTYIRPAYYTSLSIAILMLILIIGLFFYTISDNKRLSEYKASLYIMAFDKSGVLDSHKDMYNELTRSNRIDTTLNSSECNNICIDGIVMKYKVLQSKVETIEFITRLCTVILFFSFVVFNISKSIWSDINIDMKLMELRNKIEELQNK